MVYNTGTVDRLIRVATGILVVALVFLGPKLAWLGVLGILLLLTGAMGFCPVYRVLGLRTGKVRS